MKIRWDVIAIASSSITLLFSAITDAASEREPVGYVFDSVGDWIQDGVKLSHKSGDSVYAGATISLDPAYKDAKTRGAAIIINLFNGTREERSSEQPASFGKPMQMPSSLGNESSAFGRFLHAMGALFTKEPEKYLITTVRAADELRLCDAVVELKNEGADITPVFAAAPTGKYVLRVSPIDAREANMNATNEPFAFDWRAGAGKRVAVPNLSPGLWRIEVLQRNGERLFGIDAWLLAKRPASYQQMVDLFDHALAVTRKWGNNVSANEVRTFGRTALDALAHEQIE